MSQQENIIAVLDAGSSKIRVLIAEVHEGALRYRGHGIAEAAGMRKGLISDLAPAAAAIDRAAVSAETSAQTVIERCVVAVGGPHIRGVNSRGGISLGTRLREITKEDVRGAVDRARVCRPERHGQRHRARLYRHRHDRRDEHGAQRAIVEARSSR